MYLFFIFKQHISYSEVRNGALFLRFSISVILKEFESLSFVDTFHLVHRKNKLVELTSP